MKLSSDKRKLLLDGLRSSIRMKEWRIRNIKRRTEQDYAIEFRTMAYSEEKLEELKKDDISEIEEEIKELEDFYAEMNDERNQILFVPDTVQLHLHVEKK